MKKSKCFQEAHALKTLAWNKLELWTFTLRKLECFNQTRTLNTLAWSGFFYKIHHPPIPIQWLIPLRLFHFLVLIDCFDFFGIDLSWFWWDILLHGLEGDGRLLLVCFFPPLFPKNRWLTRKMRKASARIFLGKTLMQRNLRRRAPHPNKGPMGQQIVTLHISIVVDNTLLRSIAPKDRHVDEHPSLGCRKSGMRFI